MAQNGLIATDELPSHGHEASIATTNLTGTIYQSKGAEKTSVSGIVSLKTATNATGGHGDSHNDTQPTYTINASHAHTVTVQSTGDNSGHENMPPYDVVYRWKRTS